MAKRVKKLGEVFLFYERDAEIRLRSITQSDCWFIFKNNNERTNYCELRERLDIYLSYYVVGETRTTMLDGSLIIEVYLSDVVP